MADLTIGVSMDLVTPVATIEKETLKAIRDHLNNKMPRSIEKIQRELGKNLVEVFRKTNEYKALIDGPLDAHFGIPPGEMQIRLDQILETLSKQVRVKFKKISIRGGVRLTGGIVISAFYSDFEELLDIGAATVTTHKGQRLPWLEWLMIRGDEIIIADYKIKFGSGQKGSRSGGAVMIEDTSSAWRVPPGASGTQRNNWITRGVEDSIKEIEKIITNIVEQVFDRIL